jgi:hypothetical protein
MKTTRSIKALTLVELLVALMVTGILLSAVATLAFALNSASQASDDTVLKQAQLRHATLRISELVRNCRLICAAPGDDLAIWTADDNGDGQINVNELVYLERGDGLNTLQFCQFASEADPNVALGSLGLSTTKAQLISSHDETYIVLIPQCKNVQFGLDSAPPFTRLLTISFDLTEDDTDHRHEIDVALRCWAGNVLNAAGDALVTDDD